MYGDSNHAIDITIEFTIKNGSRWFITLVYLLVLIYGDSNHAMDNTIEFTLKNGFRWYITLAYMQVLPYFPVLPYMVTPTTKWTLTESTVPLHSMHMESTGTPLGVPVESLGLSGLKWDSQGICGSVRCRETCHPWHCLQGPMTQLWLTQVVSPSQFLCGSKSNIPFPVSDCHFFVKVRPERVVHRFNTQGPAKLETTTNSKSGLPLAILGFSQTDMVCSILNVHGPQDHYLPGPISGLEWVCISVIFRKARGCSEVSERQTSWNIYIPASR